jgi:hypothetical protein
MCAAITSSSKNAETTSKALRGRQLQSANLVIFGAGGDLTKRLVVLALYHLVQAGKLSNQLAIIGIDHNQQTSEQSHHLYRGHAARLIAARTGCGIRLETSVLARK